MWKIILLLESIRQKIQMFTINFTGYEMFLPAIFDYLNCLFN